MARGNRSNRANDTNASEQAAPAADGTGDAEPTAGAQQGGEVQPHQEAAPETAESPSAVNKSTGDAESTAPAAPDTAPAPDAPGASEGSAAAPAAPAEATETETATTAAATCELCGEPMPPGEEMFKYHGYSGPCPKPPKPVSPGGETSSDVTTPTFGDLGNAGLPQEHVAQAAPVASASEPTAAGMVTLQDVLNDLLDDPSTPEGYVQRRPEVRISHEEAVLQTRIYRSLERRGITLRKQAQVYGWILSELLRYEREMRADG